MESASNSPFWKTSCPPTGEWPLMDPVHVEIFGDPAPDGTYFTCLVCREFDAVYEHSIVKCRSGYPFRYGKLKDHLKLQRHQRTLGFIV